MLQLLSSPLFMTTRTEEICHLFSSVLWLSLLEGILLFSSSNHSCTSHSPCTTRPLWGLLQPHKNIKSEDGNYSVCWNAGKPSAFYATYSWKLKSYIKIIFFVQIILMLIFSLLVTVTKHVTFPEAKVICWNNFFQIILMLIFFLLITLTKGFRIHAVLDFMNFGIMVQTSHMAWTFIHIFICVFFVGRGQSPIQSPINILKDCLWLLVFWGTFWILSILLSVCLNGLVFYQMVMVVSESWICPFVLYRHLKISSDMLWFWWLEMPTNVRTEAYSNRKPNSHSNCLSMTAKHGCVVYLVWVAIQFSG
jgi:hypothetical protein